jgi:6-phosphofructokinase 1
LQYIADKVKKDKKIVIVVAEGAGEAMLDQKLPDGPVDASGHTKPGAFIIFILKDIGLYLRDTITDYCK